MRMSILLRILPAKFEDRSTQTLFRPTGSRIREAKSAAVKLFSCLAELRPSKESHSERVYHPLQFPKRSQLFIRPRNVTLAIAAMRVSNPDRSPFAIRG